MDDVSEEIYVANQKLYDQVRNSLAGVEYPDPKNVETQGLKPHFDWEKGRFKSLQMFVETNFKYLNEYNEQFVRLGQGRSNSLNVREAELQDVLEELRRCEQRLDEIENEKPEEEKEIGLKAAIGDDRLDKDPYQIAHDQKKKKQSLKFAISDRKEERATHINAKIQIVQMKQAQKQVNSKKHVEEAHDAVFRAVIQSIYNRKFQDKSEVKKNFKDDRYIRHIMMRRNASTLSADIITDMEQAIKRANQLDKLPQFIKQFVKYLDLMVIEARNVQELKQLERQIYKERPFTKTQLAEPAKYNYTDVQNLKAKIKDKIDFVERTIEQFQIQRDNSDILIQRDQQLLQNLKDEYGEVQYEHKDAQDLKRAPKQRSLSKIPIQNQRSSILTEDEGGEASVTADIKMEGPQKSKKSGGFFACCGFS